MSSFFGVGWRDQHPALGLFSCGITFFLFYVGLLPSKSAREIASQHAEDSTFASISWYREKDVLTKLGKIETKLWKIQRKQLEELIGLLYGHIFIKIFECNTT